ncbi:MAG: hypothetical protein MUE54_14020 [Anaerolineae bacterium]|jgi:hypothetical protein|nr:hypothetical protein [Anaerolineae bacterium]
MNDEQPITEIENPADAETEPLPIPTPLDEMLALRDELQNQLNAYQTLLGELRGLMTTPTPPPTAIGNPAQTPPLSVDEVRGMDVMTTKRRLDEVLAVLRGRG